MEVVKEPINYDALIDPKLPSSETCHEVIFEGLDGVVIRNSCLKTDGAAGPSGIDAAGWRRMCTSFQSASADLCDSLASVAIRMASTYVNPHGLSPLLACRLIALDKNPGVRPIGIGETSRRIISKAILFMVKTDILEAAGNLQLCAGQEAGCEAAVHAMQSLYHSSNTQAVLLADASNAFNSLNRHVSLHNLHFICPPLAVTLTNVYREASSLFIDGECLLSEEGTTQGDPLAMAMYALSTVPLIRKLDGLATQVWFADDAAAAGFLADLLVWWKQLSSLGPGYGYYVNASKSWLVVKEDCYDTACTLFAGTSLRITTEGRPYLGAPLGSPEFKSIFLQERVCQWWNDIIQLSNFASSQPHAAYSAMIHGLSSRWTFLTRTVCDLSSQLAPLEEAIRLHLLPKLCLHAPNDSERAMFALPIRQGGLGVFDPCKSSQDNYQFSTSVTSPLASAILNQLSCFDSSILQQQRALKQEALSIKRQNLSQRFSEFFPDFVQQSPTVPKTCW